MFDKGPGDIRLSNLLCDLKERHPDRVHLVSALLHIPICPRHLVEYRRPRPATPRVVISPSGYPPPSSRKKYLDLFLFAIFAAVGQPGHEQGAAHSGVGGAGGARDGDPRRRAVLGLKVRTTRAARLGLVYSLSRTSAGVGGVSVMVGQGTRNDLWCRSLETRNQS